MKVIQGIAGMGLDNTFNYGPSPTSPIPLQLPVHQGLHLDEAVDEEDVPPQIPAPVYTQFGKSGWDDFM